MNHGGSKQVVVCENISRPRCQEGIRGNSAASPPDGPCGQPGENAEKPSLLEWWAEQGSNLRPRPCKGRALPPELSARALKATRLCEGCQLPEGDGAGFVPVNRCLASWRSLGSQCGTDRTLSGSYSRRAGRDVVGTLLRPPAHRNLAAGPAPRRGLSRLRQIPSG